ncbi:MFS transporter [Pseudothermotoga thermarum]|uniref:Sugar (Glycoside-Pentoside-Hexuronide) transporter n=1 Tax=Pseudothermotoga thermarum DSM 5069 TaxID=688269 RepID=F7YVY3_9THEM|nr:glycoside-pentoside-hexuronide (GPH):cation symporter [Pseudothermotoga thermarum]AEH51812.1 sugar (Glycoside-Pentoside-Hexuronide) transporter [Pseudothermotoga thermarum DSM 5069]
MKESFSDKLSLKTKIFFGAGDIYGGGVFNIVNFFYAIFLTDVVGLDPRCAAPVFLIGKIWDAITDPLMGMISDRTKSKWGRRRPYFLFGFPFVFLSFLLLWIPVGFSSTIGKFLYVLTTYLFLNTVTTMVMVPYQAFAGEITLDYHERTSLNTIRLFFSLASSLFCAVLPMIIVNAAPDIKRGYINMALFFGALFAIPWIGVFAFTKERGFENVPKRFDIKSMFLEPLKVRSFRLLLLVYLGSYLAIDAVSIIFAYFMRWYIGKPQLLPLVLGTLILTEIAFLPVYAVIARKTSKKTAWLLGSLIWTVASILIFTLANPSIPNAMLIALAFVTGAGVSAVAVMPHAMFGDVADVGELAFGERREGSFSGLMTFIRKVASAVTQSLILYILGFAGYNPQFVAQPDRVIFVIRFILCFVPLILLAFSAIAAWKYPVSPTIHAELNRYLERKRIFGEVNVELESRFKKALV